MNKWNTLLAALDNVYGHDGKNKSSYKPINRYFNQETGEMVTVIEYKTKKQGEVVVKNPRSNQYKQRIGLLQNLLIQQKTKEKQ